MALDKVVPTAAPRTPAQFAGDINEELAELYKRGVVYLNSVAGTNTITASTNPATVAGDFANGFAVYLRPAGGNTSTVTLNIDATGAKDVRTQDGVALVSGNLVSGSSYLLLYDLTAAHWRVMNRVSQQATIVRVYTANTTWTKPTGLVSVKIKVQGGGGGGWAVSAADAGGGGGGYVEENIVAASLGATEAVTVGGGGAAGSAGGNSSFGAHATGSGGAAAVGVGTGGPGGTATGGDINIVGQRGNNAIYGGDSFLGKGGNQGNTAGSVYGGGGGGNGAGAAGVVIVEEYY